MHQFNCCSVPRLNQLSSGEFLSGGGREGRWPGEGGGVGMHQIPGGVACLDLRQLNSRCRFEWPIRAAGTYPRVKAHMYHTGYGLPVLAQVRIASLDISICQYYSAGLVCT